MEDSGSEAIKRQRLESFSIKPNSHRMNQQHPSPPLPPPLHSHPGGQALPPPSAYRQSLPPSPYPPSPYDAPSESRALPEHPPPAGYGSNYSSYGAPHREHRPPGLESQSSFSRHTGQPTPTRSPDEMQHGTAPRPLVTKFDPEQQHYPASHPRDSIDSGPVYTPHESQANGLYHQGVPMASPIHDHGQGAAPQATASSYAEQPIQHRQHSPFSAGPFSGAPGATPWANRQLPPPRKNTRAQQACETCRQRKAKCDEGKPVCGYCKENSHPCRYKEVQPAKADRAQKEIMDSLKENKDEIADVKHIVNEKIARMEATLHNFLETLRKDGAVKNDVVTEPEEDIKHDFTKESEPPTRIMAQRSPVVSPRQPYQPMEIDMNSATENGTTEVTSGSIHVVHATAAHRLLNWPIVQRMLGGYPGALNEDYVMQLEERKGLLRLFGSGQGIDRWDGVGSGDPGSPASSTSSDGLKGGSSISFPNSYGIDLGFPNMPDGKFFNNQADHPGGLNKDGTLKLDRATMLRLEQSYLDNMHICHPFLDKTRLRSMIERVHSRANPGDSKSPHFPNLSGVDPVRSLKRKHSNGESQPDPNASGTGRYSEQPLERRVSTAIVLLVMALGKIFEHKADLPGPIPEVRKEKFSPGNTSSPHSHTPSPATAVSSPASIVEQRLSSPLIRKNDRNFDIIPGLAYFARATEMLGGIQGNDLPHVQANLLAALYTSQLACTIESWTWIHHACRACHFLVRDPTFSKERDRTRVQLIRFAFWTCLQLESDVLAELDLKPSGISGIQDDEEKKIDYPKISDDSIIFLNQELSPEQRMEVYYSFQLILRKGMNEWQVQLYPPNRYKQTEGFSLGMRNACDESLCSWRLHLPHHIQWDDTDEPATDINAARLRGKYYGAKYIIHRPFLFYAMQYIPPERITSEVREIYDRWERNPLEVGLKPAPPSANAEDKTAWETAQILISCRLCVDAAKSSTLTFDGVRKVSRLIVTNIFGTAHAQFGNMLVIAAVLQSHLSWLIEKREVIKLLDRTINFLRSLAPISTTLGTDANLLETIKAKIDPRPTMHTSFSSTG